VLLATSKVLKDYGNIYALPVTFVLDRNHRIVKKITGMVNEGELNTLIEDLLEEQKI
jgi:peroxiredoxin